MDRSMDSQYVDQVRLGKIAETMRDKGIRNETLRAKIWPIMAGTGAYYLDKATYMFLSKVEYQEQWDDLGPNFSTVIDRDVPRAMHISRLSHNVEMYQSALKRMLNATVNIHRYIQLNDSCKQSKFLQALEEQAKLRSIDIYFDGVELISAPSSNLLTHKSKQLEKLYQSQCTSQPNLESAVASGTIMGQIEQVYVEPGMQEGRQFWNDVLDDSDPEDSFQSIGTQETSSSVADFLSVDMQHSPQAPSPPSSSNSEGVLKTSYSESSELKERFESYSSQNCTEVSQIYREDERDIQDEVFVSGNGAETLQKTTMHQNQTAQSHSGYQQAHHQQSNLRQRTRQASAPTLERHNSTSHTRSKAEKKGFAQQEQARHRAVSLPRGKLRQTTKVQHNILAENKTQRQWGRKSTESDDQGQGSSPMSGVAGWSTANNRSLQQQVAGEHGSSLPPNIKRNTTNAQLKLSSLQSSTLWQPMRQVHAQARITEPNPVSLASASNTPTRSRGLQGWPQKQRKGQSLTKDMVEQYSTVDSRHGTSAMWQRGVDRLDSRGVPASQARTSTRQPLSVQDRLNKFREYFLYVREKQDKLVHKYIDALHLSTSSTAHTPEQGARNHSHRSSDDHSCNSSESRAANGSSPEQSTNRARKGSVRGAGDSSAGSSTAGSTPAVSNSASEAGTKAAYSGNTSSPVSTSAQHSPNERPKRLQLRLKPLESPPGGNHVSCPCGTPDQKQQDRASDYDRSVYYYQGLHDIASVLLLSVGEDIGFKVLLGLVTRHLRDYTRQGMGVVVESQQALLHLIQIYDHKLALHIQKLSIPPFFGVSWQVTWFAHVCYHLPTLQRLYDFFLASHPLMSMYFAVVLMGEQRRLILKENDVGEVHTLLSKLPVPQDKGKLARMLMKADNLFKRIPPMQLYKEVQVPPSESVLFHVRNVGGVYVVSSIPCAPATNAVSDAGLQLVQRYLEWMGMQPMMSTIQKRYYQLGLTVLAAIVKSVDTNQKLMMSEQLTYLGESLEYAMGEEV